ncbi:hypothetical protein CR513_60501, partial [Mucuna pruriens]
MLLNKKEPLLLLYTNMCLVLNSSLENLPMLKEFKDILPREISLIRGIEHQIDFMPSASLSNCPAYRANPE